MLTVLTTHVSNAAFHVSVDLTINTAARSIELTDRMLSYGYVTTQRTSILCKVYVCVVCILMQSVHTEYAGIIMMMLLLHIWGIPGSNFSMDTSCLETSYRDGFQCQRNTSNEVVRILSHPLQFIIY